MKRYYINRGNFANQYALCYVDGNQELPEGWERITRKEAEEAARREADRRKWDQAMSGYAPQYVLPYGMDECEIDPYYMNVKYYLSGRVLIMLK